MTTWPEHFIVYCIGRGEADAHPPVEIYSIGVDPDRELIDTDPYPVAYVVGLSFDERVNRDRLRMTTTVWECPVCGLSVRMSHADDRVRNLPIDAIQAGHLRVSLAEWIRVYDSPEVRQAYPGSLIEQ